jgi:hypothetical protein
MVPSHRTWPGAIWNKLPQCRNIVDIFLLGGRTERHLVFNERRGAQNWNAQSVSLKPCRLLYGDNGIEPRHFSYKIKTSKGTICFAPPHPERLQELNFFIALQGPSMPYIIHQSSLVLLCVKDQQIEVATLTSMPCMFIATPPAIANTTDSSRSHWTRFFSYFFEYRHLGSSCVDRR